MDTESSDDDKKMMVMNKRILVAVDESEESMYALSWCLHNLIQFNHQNENENENIKLVLLYVKPPPPVYSSLDAPGYFLGGNEIATIEKYRKDLATSVMQKAETICRDFDIKVEKKIGTGEAKDVICLAADKLRADMLVMGSHDYGFFKKAFLGSVSEYCAKNVRCPTVVVKRPKRAAQMG